MSLDIYNFNNFPTFKDPVFIIGSFESFHLGHYELYKKAKELQANEPERDIVLVFLKDIENINKYKNPFIFSDFNNRIQEFANLGFQKAIYLEFNKIANLEPSEFIKKLTTNQNNFHIIVGEDFKYGAKAKGNVSTLKEEIGSDKITAMPFLKVNESIKISTSFLKECLELGDIELVNSLNCFTYSFSSKLINHNLDDHVINMQVDDNLVLLRAGLYLSYVEINNYVYYAILRANLDGDYDLKFVDFALKDNEEINSRIKVLKPLRFFVKPSDEAISETDINNSKKQFIKK